MTAKHFSISLQKATDSNRKQTSITYKEKAYRSVIVPKKLYTLMEEQNAAKWAQANQFDKSVTGEPIKEFVRSNSILGRSWACSAEDIQTEQHMQGKCHHASAGDAGRDHLKSLSTKLEDIFGLNKIEGLLPKVRSSG